jgi:hypothetical protein
VQESRHTYAFGAAVAQHLEQVGNRQPGIHDVFDHQHVLAGNRSPEIVGNSRDTARLGGVAIAGDAQEIDGHRAIDLARQIRQEDEAAAQDADQQQVAGRMVAGNLGGELVDARGDSLGRNQLSNWCGRHRELLPIFRDNFHIQLDAL